MVVNGTDHEINQQGHTFEQESSTFKGLNNRQVQQPPRLQRSR